MPRLKHVEFWNCGPFEHMSFPVDAVLMIRGDNGKGKTTLLKVITTALQGGHQPGLIKDEEDSARILFTLDDDMTIDRIISRSKYELVIKAADGRVIPRGETFCKSLATGFALDPLALMTADKKEREKYLLRVMPIVFSGSEIADRAKSTGKLMARYTLEQFDALLDGHMERRKDLNGKARDLQGTRETLLDTLPKDIGEDWAAKQQEIRRDHALTMTEQDIALAAADKVVDTEIAEARAASSSAIRVLDQQLEEAISALRITHNQKLESVYGILATQVAEVQREAEFKKAGIRAEHEPRIADLSRQLGEATAKTEEQQRAVGARATIAKVERQSAEFSEQADVLTQEIKALRELRTQKLATLPVQGVECRGGDIIVDGRDFDTQLNTAEQYKVCLQIGRLGIPEDGMPIMVIDGAESLNPENQRWIVEAAKEEGLQILMTEMVPGLDLELVEA